MLTASLIALDISIAVTAAREPRLNLQNPTSNRIDMPAPPNIQTRMENIVGASWHNQPIGRIVYHLHIAYNNP